MYKIILHIDFDSFFASVEQQNNPLFRNKPLGVTAHNGRTAIIAASREAKRRGLTNIMRSYDAFRICPDLLLTRANFDKYWEISKKFVAICKDFSPYVEVFSIDELFMDITLSAHLFGGVTRLITQIKKRIKDEIGEYITVSVGVSHNKLLAKLASGMKKPNGVFVIRPDQVEQVYKVAKLTDICGIGARLERRLNAMGVYTLLQLRRTPLQFLVAEFGNVAGHHLKNIGMGADETTLTSYTEVPEVKSVGRNYCLPENQYDRRIVLQNIYELCEEIGIKLRRLGKKARTVGLYLRGTEETAGRKTFSTYMDTGAELINAVMFSIHNTLPSGYVRQMGVWAASLTDACLVPSSLLSYDNQKYKVLKVVDQLNEKYGHHTIRNGFLLYADKLTIVLNGFMADKYERTKLAEEASAALSE